MNIKDNSPLAKFDQDGHRSKLALDALNEIEHTLKLVLEMIEMLKKSNVIQ